MNVAPLLLLLLVGQADDTSRPDRTGEFWSESPVYRGETADAPIPVDMHLRNEDGSAPGPRDGLCVPTSVTIAAMYQGIPGFEGGKESKLWKTAKSRPGGYYPDLLAKLVQETCPGEGFINIETRNPEDLERLSQAGYPVGITYNTGRLYDYQRIAHMVTGVHFRKDGWAAVVDNNNPGVFSIMPGRELWKRATGDGAAWIFAWTRPLRRAAKWLGFLLATSGVCLIIGKARRQREWAL